MTQADRLQWRLDGIRATALIIGWSESSLKAARKLAARIERVKK